MEKLNDNIKYVSDCCKAGWRVDTEKTYYLLGIWLTKEWYICQKCGKNCELDLVEGK